MCLLSRLTPSERRGVYSDLSKATEDDIVYVGSDTWMLLKKVECVIPAVGG